MPDKMQVDLWFDDAEGEDDNDFFIKPPAAIPLAYHSQDYFLEDISDSLAGEFVLDDATPDSHPALVAIRDYLMRCTNPKTIAAVRNALKKKVDQEYLCNTLILRCMCYLRDRGLGEVKDGERTCRFVVVS